MSYSVETALIIAGTVVLVIFLLRGSLKRFSIKANQKSVEGRIETHAPDAKSGGAPAAHGVVVRGNRQVGTNQKIEVRRGDAQVSDNVQAGKDQKIDIGP